MEKDNWIIQAEKTIQVSEDSWRRQTEQASISQESTLKEVLWWAERNGVDMNSIRLLPISEISKPPTNGNR